MSNTPITDNWLDSQPPTLFLARRQMEHLERELNSAKAENEAMRDVIKDALRAIYDLRLHASDDCDQSLANLAITKLQPFLK